MDRRWCIQACAQGHEACVKLLLDYGALSSAHKTNGFTPLHYAAAGGHVSIVRLLISRLVRYIAIYKHALNYKCLH